MGQHHWIELDNNPTREYLDHFKQDKIVWNPVSGEYYFTKLEKGAYLDNSLFMMIFKNSENIMPYVLGLMNSKLLRWLTLLVTNLVEEGTYAYGAKEKIEKLSIPQITESNQSIADEIIALVEEILKAKEQNPKADTSAQEDKIDELVYQLYNLTPEEIKIIESNNG